MFINTTKSLEDNFTDFKRIIYAYVWVHVEENIHIETEETQTLFFFFFANL